VGKMCNAEICHMSMAGHSIFLLVLLITTSDPVGCAAQKTLYAYVISPPQFTET